MTSGITFDSNFESGNLFLVLKSDSVNTYDLILQNDINTRGNTQWFFFSVTGVPQNTKITFRIINHVKTVLYDRLNLGLYLIVVYNLQFIRNRLKNLTKLNGTEEGLTYPIKEVIIAG